MPDAHLNFAYSLVATAPSPATSGTSLIVTAGQGALFPTVPFNATIWPTGAQPTSLNAEIVRVTARSTDTLTVGRAQESSSARTILVGDQIAATVTAKTLTDVEAGFSPDMPLTPLRIVRDNVISTYTGVHVPGGVLELGAGWYGGTNKGTGTSVGAGSVFAAPVTLPANATIVDVFLYSQTVGAANFTVSGNVRFGVYADSGGAPGHLLCSSAPVAFLAADTVVRGSISTPSTVVGEAAWLAYQPSVNSMAVAADSVFSTGALDATATYAGGLSDPFNLDVAGAGIVEILGLVGGMVEIGASSVLEIA